MASAQKFVTVDLGSSTLKVGEFALTKGGALTLLRFGVSELGLDPNKEEDRGPFVTSALANLFKELGVRGRDVRLSISGQSVFIKFIKLPPVAADQVEQVVMFEAQQNVPFPINEVTWDYQMMPSRGNGTEAEAVIVAIKKDVLEGDVSAVEKAGVRIRQVDVAPFALLNAFRYSEPQTEDCSLIIDMGARSTNLVFVEKGGFWIRNIPIAGNQISQSICNELQEPFNAAETLKKGKGFVSLGGVYADPDDVDAARISKLIRTTMTRLHNDINRSIAYYRTTLGGTPPKRVFLTGGSSQLPYLDLFIADKLNLPVAFFNPLRNVALGPQLNTAKLQQQNCYTGELVGLALRPSGSCPAEITLIAPTLAARADKKRKQPYFYAALVAWIFLFVCLGPLLTGSRSSSRKQTTEKLRAQTVGLKRRRAADRQALGAGAGAARHHRPGRAARPAARRVARHSRRAQRQDSRGRLDHAAHSRLRSQGRRRPANAGGPRRPGRAPGADGSGRNKARPRPPRVSEGLGGYAAADRPDQRARHQRALPRQRQDPPKVDPARLRDFVQSLSDEPQFDIDPKKQSETLVSFETPRPIPAVFAETFSMHLKLKQPIELTP